MSLLRANVLRKTTVTPKNWYSEKGKKAFRVSIKMIQSCSSKGKQRRNKSLKLQQDQVSQPQRTTRSCEPYQPSYLTDPSMT